MPNAHTDLPALQPISQKNVNIDTSNRIFITSGSVPAKRKCKISILTLTSTTQTLLRSYHKTSSHNCTQDPNQAAHKYLPKNCAIQRCLYTSQITARRHKNLLHTHFKRQYPSTPITANTNPTNQQSFHTIQKHVGQGATSPTDL